MNKDEIAGLVERLRGISGSCSNDDCEVCETVVEAADALTTLSAENEALRHDVQRQMAIAIEHVNESATLSARVETLEAALRECIDVMEPMAKYPKVNPWLIQAKAALGGDNG